MKFETALFSFKCLFIEVLQGYSAPYSATSIYIYQITIILRELFELFIATVNMICPNKSLKLFCRVLNKSKV